jgi:hypothetical protein
MWLRLARRSSLALVSTLALTAAPLRGGTVVLQNDSVVDFGTAAIQAGFVADEWGAAWLTSTCTGDVTALRYLWLSLPPTGGTTLGQAVAIAAAGAFPVPGPTFRELLGPVFTEGAFNDVALDPPIPIHEGQVVVVMYQFFEDPPPNGPSLVTDVNGCQAGKNAIFAIPPSAWFNACLFGISGDLSIRAVVDCQPNVIFRDGFEIGTTVVWSFTAP